MRIRVHPDILNIPQTKREPIHMACRGREDLVNLSSGNPDQAMPDFIVEQLKKSLDSGRVPYTDYYGIPELRTRISETLRKDWDIIADPATEIAVTSGVQEGLYVVMRSLLHPGDEVLIPSPHYGNYFQNTVACGGKPVLVQLEEKTGFMPDFDRFKKAITPNTRFLIFCNPNNPLGVVWPGEVLQGLADLALAHDLIVLVDEIYRDFTYYRPAESIGALPGMKERTFTFGGFSKSHMMMGLRIGFVAGPEAPMAAVKKLHYCIALCPSYLGQVAALAALDCPQEQLDCFIREYQDRIEMLHKGMTEIPGVTCVLPQGGFYVFPNVKRFGLNSMELAIQMIENASVITLPGTEFGPYGEGYLRLAVCERREHLEMGIERLKDFARRY
ncbi:MAG: pyridoxal phosphate-dependent aminotransferase [Deltaproteobacteria bacterium]|nr:pyridoxal phosphate-dependent aminotransferase [Deltaproteobacteria bacterium]